jgi:hypothetical protein
MVAGGRHKGQGTRNKNENPMTKNQKAALGMVQDTSIKEQEYRSLYEFLECIFLCFCVSVANFFSISV